MKAGPKVTMKMDGKMNKTKGNTSFTVVLAARSSARWRRCVRNVSE
jgi:hypothetical protein